jgi:putative transposase
MKTTDYPSDLTDRQFALIEPLLPQAKPGGRPRTANLHDVLDAVFYVNRTGCQWRYLPKDFPPFTTVHTYYRAWRNDGTWQRVLDALRQRTRTKAGREPTPSACAIDSQSAKAGGAGGEVGYDAGKKTHGRKRPIVVDTLGLLLAVVVTAASVPDARAACDPLALLPLAELPRLRVVWADAAYAAGYLREGVAAWGQYRLEVVSRPPGSTGWLVPPRRWVVERTFAWPLRYRRHARDFERLTESSEAMVMVSMVHLMARRLEPEAAEHPFRYRAAA